MDLGNTGAFHNADHILGVDATRRRYLAMLSGLFNQPLQCGDAVVGKGCAARGEQTVDAKRQTALQHLQGIGGMVHGAVKGELTFRCQLGHGPDQITVHGSIDLQPTSDQADGTSSEDLGIEQQGVQGSLVIRETSRSGPYQHTSRNSYCGAHRIHKPGTWCNAAACQPTAHFHRVATGTFRRYGFFHTRYTDFNCDTHAPKVWLRLLATCCGYLRITTTMFVQLRLSPGTLLAMLLFWQSGAVHASLAQDIVHISANDAVSANQRASALMASAYRNLATDPLGAHRSAVQAVAQAESSGDPLLEHKALICLGKVEERSGFYTDMMKTTLRAVRLAQDLGDPQLIALDLRELSSAYRLNGMSSKAVEEARNSLAMMLPTRPLEEVEEARAFLINTLLDAGQLDEAGRLAERSLTMARERADAPHEARMLQAMGAIMIEQQRFSDAVTYLALAGRYLDEHGKPQDRFNYQGSMARAYIGLGRVNEAGAAVAGAAALLPSVDNWKNRALLMDLRYNVAMAQGNWRDAVSLLQRIKSVSDSALTARLDLQMARLQMSYQLDRKEQANAQLRDENAKSAELIAGAELHNKLLIALLVLLSASSVALFLTGRYSRRMARRMKLKNAVIKRQHDEIHSKNLELKRQNLRLTETLMSEEEKEMMIKEIHHRVKNNLQVVDSLLQIQCIDSKEPAVGKVLREAQGRIRSMALVHEHIYRTASGDPGDLRSHLEKLVRNILVAYGAHDRISVSVDSKLPSFPTETLLPLTLVVNELFTNAVKYAFPGEATGRISVAVRTAGTGYELLFSDDGAGIGLADGGVRERSFGLELVKLLAEQLNGELRFLKGAGTTVSLTFVPDPVPMRVAS